MILGIDASNIRRGGGVTHLVELLRAAEPEMHGFSRVLVWSGRSTLDVLEARPWLDKRHQRHLDGHLLRRVWWQRYHLSDLARKAKCDLLFVPGGAYAGDFFPFATMNQNLLPFESKEVRRYGFSLRSAKFMLLRVIQRRTYRQSGGVIFLTEYAQEAVQRAIGALSAGTRIVPHGVDSRFDCPPREQLPIERYSVEDPFRIIYVSTVDEYKHQWYVAEAIAKLVSDGMPIALDLVGSAYPPSLRRLKRTLARLDPRGVFIRYRGSVSHGEIQGWYRDADLGLFASSCETFGQILTEAMASGLPIACSNRSAMPEILADAGVYFDPEDPGDIARTLAALIDTTEKRTAMARASYSRVRAFSWQRCARETFDFLSLIAGEPRRS